MKKVLFAASECVPFIKTGGLADVCGALPKQFDKKEWDVRVVIPNYSCIPEKYRNKFEYVTHFYMGTGPYIPSKYVGVLKYELDGITYYFIDNQEYFNCFLPYGDIRYDIEKFTFFDKAVLSMLPQIGFQPDIIHCHDWQAGLIPVFLKTEFQGDMFFWGMKAIMTIHNLKFQGVWDVKTMMGLTGFPKELFTPDKLEFQKDANMLKGGLVYADYITTVSDTYAQEIQTPYYGEGLDGLLSARHFDMQGIVNGIDYDIYNPETDPKLFVNYNRDNFRKKKVENKVKLQEMLGLTVDKKKYMIGLISRLTDQKGLDLVDYVFERILDDNTQFVVIGTGQGTVQPGGHDHAAVALGLGAGKHGILAAVQLLDLPGGGIAVAGRDMPAGQLPFGHPPGQHRRTVAGGVVFSAGHQLPGCAFGALLIAVGLQNGRCCGGRVKGADAFVQKIKQTL